ncbi:L-rhamnose-binding lectin CSL3-like [Cyprinus carpio]|uniref:L-rhamnose-binding lectin CSL3-like n=1 Tax=Cyprinus carpio TaxID=7962 RepID=A0A9R0API0_CYPCA|nr:L-rhamnose-binding lectin CSL3-like [Cyprinus carpio]
MHCFQRASLRIMSNRCDARKRCSVPAMNTVFSDPCAWTYKYLDVHYVCVCAMERKSCSVHAVNSVFNDPCVGTYKYLQVSYECRLVKQHVTCESFRGVHYLWCNGKKSCHVLASNSVFSDPCVGVYKYLEVAYSCKK